MDKDSEEDNEGSNTPSSDRQDIEVLYADGMWYQAWPSSFN
jgi:hypothetical protein